MGITDEIIKLFRERQPAFTDEKIWPKLTVESALIEADAETGGARWGGYLPDASNFKLRGMFFFAAHWLSVTYTTTSGACVPSDISPTARLNVASKSVGDESIVYRVGAIQDTEDDWLSLTNYGVQYLRLRKRCGMGAMVV